MIDAAEFSREKIGAPCRPDTKSREGLHSTVSNTVLLPTCKLDGSRYTHTSQHNTGQAFWCHVGQTFQCIFKWW